VDAAARPWGDGIPKDADVKRVEQLLLQCAKMRTFRSTEGVGEGNLPTKEQCDEVVRQERAKT
jgi:hypothetical protein